MKRNNLQKRLCYICLLLVLAITSVFLRAHLAQNRPLSGHLDADDATAHVAVTLLAFQQTESSIHKYLPIASLGNPLDKWINYLPYASVFDKSGNLYYTSFPPLLFNIPYFLFRFLNIDSPEVSLRFFSIALHLIATLCLGYLISLVVKTRDPKNQEIFNPVIIGTTIFFFSFECLRSYTFSYWGQHLYQIILLLQATCFLKIVTDSRKSGAWLSFLFVISIVGCLIEWTAYVTVAAIFGLSVYRFFITKKPKDLVPSAICIATVCLAFLILLIWYSSVIGLDAYLSALSHRFLARQSLGGGRSGAFPYMILLWFLSIGSFWLVLITSFYTLFNSRTALERKDIKSTISINNLMLRPDFLVGMVLFLPIGENILLAGHVSEYPFDIIKFVAAMAYFCAIVWRKNSSISYFILPLTVTASLLTFSQFTELYFVRQRWVWNKLPIAWYKKIGTLVKDTSSEKSVLFSSNSAIRGDVTYYSSRNIEEMVGITAYSQGISIEDYILRKCALANAHNGIMYYAENGISKVWVETISTEAISWKSYDLDTLP